MKEASTIGGRWAAFVLALLAALLAGAPDPAPAAEAENPAPTAAPSPPAEPPKAEPAGPEPKLVLSQWQSLYLAGKKIGYVMQNLYAFPDGGRRLQTHEFLRQALSSDKFGFYKIITADVDARFRPRALECRVVSGEREWTVKGHAEDREFVLTRTVGQTAATARIPLDEDVTLRCWALLATLMGGVRPGDGRRWLVIDESLGALLPDPCVVRVLGPQSVLNAAGDRTLEGLAVMCECGPEQVAHLVDSGGRTLRSIWQSAPMVAEATSLSEARRLDTPDGPHGVEIEGFEGDRYRNLALGFSLWVPPYPYVTNAVPAAGLVNIVDLTDEVSVYAHAASGPRPTSAVPLTPADLDHQADLIQREWASRFEEVKVVPRPAMTMSSGVPASATRLAEGTARLGCTTFHFRNMVLRSEGVMWFLSVTVADRPITSKPVLADNVLASVKVSAPEGRLPVQVTGNMVRSPYYGFEIARPSARWQIPARLEGPLTALEMAREDHAAAVILRILTPKPKQSLEAVAAEQAKAAADNLGVIRPDPKAATLADQKAVEFAYEGPKILSGSPGRCTAVYTPLGSRILALFLVVRTDADETAAKDLDQIRRSLKLSAAVPPAESPGPLDR